MTAYWLTFTPQNESPKRGWPIEDLRRLVRQASSDPNASEWWRIANGHATPGERVYIFKQGTQSPRGIFGVGDVVAPPEMCATPTDPEEHLRAKIVFQKLVDPTAEFLLSLDQISDFVPQTLINAQSSGTRVENAVAAELERRLAPLLPSEESSLESGDADDTSHDSDGDRDDRIRAMRAICIRRGQLAFRNGLLAAYQGRCAVTGCGVADVLEAAHISPYRGPFSDRMCNGLLLRADVHTLFDCGLLAFDPLTMQVVLAERIKSSNYRGLEGKRLRNPTNPTDRPDAVALAQRRAAMIS